MYHQKKLLLSLAISLLALPLLSHAVPCDNGIMIAEKCIEKDRTTLIIEDAMMADYAQLNQLTQLERLHLVYPIEIDWQAIKAIPNLTELWFHRADFDDLAPLADFKQIEELLFFGMNLGTLDPLMDMPMLKNLYLDACAINDLWAVTKLTQLQKLKISNTGFYQTEILAPLTQLKYLNLSVSTVTDISPLAGLTQLEELYLGKQKYRISIF